MDKDTKDNAKQDSAADGKLSSNSGSNNGDLNKSLETVIKSIQDPEAAVKGLFRMGFNRIIDKSLEVVHGEESTLHAKRSDKHFRNLDFSKAIKEAVAATKTSNQMEIARIIGSSAIDYTVGQKSLDHGSDAFGKIGDLDLKGSFTASLSAFKEGIKNQSDLIAWMGGGATNALKDVAVNTVTAVTASKAPPAPGDPNFIGPPRESFGPPREFFGPPLPTPKKTKQAKQHKPHNPDSAHR